MSGERRRVFVRISGRVQRVGFRWFVQRRASDLALTGWVRNAADGNVEVEAEGAAESVARLIEALRRGPSQAVVQSVDAEERAVVAVAQHDSFEILP